MTEADHPFKKLVLIDGSGYIFRAYHGLPPLTRKSDGLPVGAVSGFCNMVFRLIKENRGHDRPSHLAVIFDAGSRTFRHDIYADYKANRPPAPEDLIPQFPLIREATLAFGLPAVELIGYEADDLIATYAKEARTLGFEVVIISSDKDLMQLVGEGVSLMDPVKSTLVGREEVIEKFGVPPELVVDAQALIGDASDNVPGAPGIGVKTAAALLLEYGSLDALLSRADEIKQQKRRETLFEFRSQILMSRELVTLDPKVPLPAPIEAFALKDPDEAELAAFLAKMEFASLAKRVGGALSGLSLGSAPAQSATRPSNPSAGPSAAPSVAPTVAQGIDYDRYETVTTLEALQSWIAKANNTMVVAVDTETDDLSATSAGLVGISLAISPNEACYIPLKHRAKDGLDFDAQNLQQIDFDAALSALKPLLEDEGVLKIGQNIKYDLSVFARYGIDVTPFDDTMLISYVLDAGLHGHGMDELSRIHLDHTPISFKEVTGTGKAFISFDQVDLKTATRYAAEDADITFRLWQILKTRLAKSGRLSVYESLERPLIKVLSEMELLGIAIDQAVLQALSHDFGTRLNALEEAAQSEAGRPFNLNSPKQLGEIFFEERKLSGGKKTASGTWATDVKVLEELSERGDALAKLLMDYRQLAKLKSTYTDALSQHADHNSRVHTSYHLGATTTGRLSSNEPNLQNIPIRTLEGRKIRTAFVAKPDHLLISADYSQIELRLLAHIGKIDTLKNAFARGLDIHALTASEMFQVPLDQMNSEIRRRAKAINFGIIYGISAFGLAAQLGIDQGEAGRYIKTYFERFPGIKAYMDETKSFVREFGYVETLFGRRIHIPDINGKAAGQKAFAERAAINAPIQGTAADIIRRAMIQMPKALTEAGFATRMLLQVHDELIFEAPEAEAHAVIPLIKKVMESAALPAVDISVPLNVEAKAAKNWDEAH